MVANPSVELRPRGVLELFDQALRLYRNNFFSFVGIIAVAEIPIQLVQLLVNFLIFRGMAADSASLSSAPLQSQMGTSVANIIYAILSFIFVHGLASAALTRAISGRYLGEEISLSEAYQKIRPRWGSLVAALFLVGVLAIPLLIWAAVPCAGWVTGFGMLFFLATVIAPLIAPIIVVEGQNASAAVRRGWELARKRFWGLTGFFLLLLLFNLLVVQGPVQAVTLAIQGAILSGAASANFATTAVLQAISISVLALALNLLYLPLASTCAALAYFDLRARSEGLDLLLLSGEGGETPAAALALAGSAPVSARTSLITWREMGNFALMSLIFVGVYAALWSILFALILAVAAAGGGM